MTHEEKRQYLRKAFEMKDRVLKALEGNRMKHVQVFPLADIDSEVFGIHLTSLDLGADYKARVLGFIESEFGSELTLSKERATTASFKLI